MEKAFEILHANTTHSNKHMFVLTDGSSPDVPLNGYLGSMRLLKHQHEGRYPCAVHAFGFGYDLDSSLLLDIAREGNGMYAFISDGTMVGTVFINALANACTIQSHNATLAIETLNGSRIQRIEGILSKFYKPESWGGTISLSAIQSASQWNICVHFDRAIATMDSLALKLYYINSNTGRQLLTNISTAHLFSPEVINSRIHFYL